MARKNKIRAARNGRPGKQMPDPTPEEIRRGCAEIQSTWTAAERAKRASMAYKPWTPPTITEAVGLGDPAASGD